MNEAIQRMDISITTTDDLLSVLKSNKEGIFVKVPVFSFSKLTRVDVTLGPEMKSTGEVMGKDSTLEKALYKGLIGAGRKVPLHGSILFTIDDVNKPEAAKLAKRFYDIGFKIWATRGTSRYFNELNIPTKIGYKIEKTKPSTSEPIGIKYLQVFSNVFRIKKLKLRLK